MADKTLVIVESPAKAKKIAGYLGPDYTVMASVGHVRDLAAKASELPEADRKQPWAKLAVDVDHDFKPYYVVHASKTKTIAELKKALKDADELLLATDEDREGEAISWHLLEVLRPKVPVQRMVFNEITPEAIREAVAHPRDLDMNLVEAQETRRIVDRLYGFPVSQVLWMKIGQGAKSAGRVQSVAVRLVVDRERERIAFRSADYWDIVGVFAPGLVRRQAHVGRRRARASRAATSTSRARSRSRPSSLLDEARAPGPRRRPGGSRVHGALGRPEARPAAAEGAVHHVDAAAGGVQPPALGRPAHDARGAVAVRERLHHLHAHRLGEPVGAGRQRGPQPGPRAVRRRVRARRARGATRAR